MPVGQAKGSLHAEAVRKTQTKALDLSVSLHVSGLWLLLL